MHGWPVGAGPGGRERTQRAIAKTVSWHNGRRIAGVTDGDSGRAELGRGLAL
jgi:hypothetical protein